MKKILNNRFLQFSMVLAAGLFFGWLIFKSDATKEHQYSHEIDGETTYTCSMHPQIRQNEPGNCPICGMDLIPVMQETESGERSPFVYMMTPEAIALANVQTQTVQAVTPVREVFLTGRVAVNEQRLAVITANFSGRIEKLFVDFTGQTVKKGQKLATIYSPELVTAQKELIEAAKFKDVNPALYNAAREKLRLWRITETQINQIESKGEVLTEFDVYADNSGVVIRRNIAVGDFVSRGAVLFEIADLSNVWVLLDAFERDLPFLKIGQRISFTLNAVPGREFTSSISFIDPVINPPTRTASVRAEVNNSQQLLKPEMFLNARIMASLSANEKSLVVPNSSILWTGKRSIVYVKVPDAEFPSFEMREITLGPSLGDYYIVNSGLSEGEEIVTNGVFAVDAAAQLSGNYSMMNRPVDNTIAVPDRFTDQLTEFVNQYFELKNSLVHGNFQLAQSSAERLKSSLNKIDMEILDDQAHNIWMQHFLELEKQTELLVNAGNIAEQREVLSPLSKQLIEIVDKFRLKTQTVFVSYCPMAFDNKGAYWLSEFEQIKNPYFGDAMLECGEVRRTIRMNEKTEPKINQPGVHQH